MAAALGALLGAVAGPGMEAGLGQISAKQAFDRSKYVSNRQMGAAQFLAQNQPTWAMEGLRRAGLNPILAATRGFPGAEFAPQVGAQAARVPSGGALVSSARQVARMPEELRALRAMADRSESEATTARNVATASEALPTMRWWEANNEAERWSQLRETVRLLQEQQLATAAGRDRTIVDKHLLETQLPSARAVEELYEKYPILRKAGAVIKDLTSGR